MTAVQQRRRSGLRRTVVGAPLIVVLTILATILLLNAWQADDDANDAPVVMIDVEVGGHCRLIPGSCSELLTASGVALSTDGSFTIEREMTLRAAAAIDADTPAEAVVLIPAPPPRSA